jgi:hypothetical protein
MNPHVLFPLIFFITITVSCSKEENKTTQIEGTLIRVNHYEEDCVGLIEQECFLVQQEDAIGSDNWTFFYDDIVGFTFIAGFIYDLDVKIEERNPIPQDIGKYSYTLVKVLSKQKAGDSLNIN